MLQPSKSRRKPLETLDVDNLRIEPARYDIPRHCRPAPTSLPHCVSSAWACMAFNPTSWREIVVVKGGNGVFS